MAEAALERAVPVLVAYDIPGRDCAQYSAGGALNQADYEAWISGFAQGIGNRKAVVILEPDALGNLPSSCGLPASTYPFTDAERIAELQYAVSALEADPGRERVPGRHAQRLAVGRRRSPSACSQPACSRRRASTSTCRTTSRTRTSSTTAPGSPTASRW